MMPLCTTATSPERWGWALVSLGRPWVAQRVWPMPRRPLTGSLASFSARRLSLPWARRTVKASGPVTTASPALS